MNYKGALDFLRAGGRRITKKRRLVLQIIEANPHLDASEIYQLAREKDRKISLSTVYRTMNMLRDLGLIEASPLGEDHYHYEVHLKEHYHLICLGCGKVVEIPPVKAVKRLGEEKGFGVVGVKLEILGYCKDCQRKLSAAGEKAGSAKRRTHKKTGRIVDLRGIPLLYHPKVVAQEVGEAHPGELLEIITDDPRRMEMAPKMLKNTEGLELIDIWQDGAECHALVRCN